LAGPKWADKLATPFRDAATPSCSATVYVTKPALSLVEVFRCGHSRIPGRWGGMSDRPDGWGNAQLAALGTIVVNFADLDWYAGRLLGGFIRPGGIAAILTAGEELRWKLEKLSVIADQTLGDQEAGSDLRTWIKAAGDLAGRRNKLMHSFYLAPDGGQPLTRMKASTRGSRWRGESEPVALADLNEVAAMIAEGLGAADQIVALLASCPEWQDPADPSHRVSEDARLPAPGQDRLSVYPGSTPLGPLASVIPIR
jgi:hypothetical protein